MADNIVDVWITVRRFDLSEAPGDPPPARALQVPRLLAGAPHAMKSLLCSWLGDVDETAIVLKLRDTEERLLPYSMLLLVTTAQDSPLLLDVVTINRTNALSANPPVLYNQQKRCIKDFIDSLTNRVSRMEKEVPDFPTRREAIIQKKCKEYKTLVKFINSRFEETLPQHLRKEYKQILQTKISNRVET